MNVSSLSGIDQLAHQAATSPFSKLRLPTEAQKDAGNYVKGHLALHGMNISIENPVGSTRSGTDSDGKSWHTKMQHHYGYLTGTIGADDSHIDVFIGDDHDSQKVFVVDQSDPKTGEFDEHKCMLGFNTLDAAKQAYLDNYEKGWEGGESVTETSLDEFKRWLKEGDTRQPFRLIKNGASPADSEGSGKVSTLALKPGLQQMQQAKAAKEYRPGLEKMQQAKAARQIA